jgi:hypothetical protein
MPKDIIQYMHCPGYFYYNVGLSLEFSAYMRWPRPVKGTLTRHRQRTLLVYAESPVHCIRA